MILVCTNRIWEGKQRFGLIISHNKNNRLSDTQNAKNARVMSQSVYSVFLAKHVRYFLGWFIWHFFAKMKLHSEYLITILMKCICWKWRGKMYWKIEDFCWHFGHFIVISRHVLNLLNFFNTKTKQTLLFAALRSLSSKGFQNTICSKSGIYL